MPSKPRHVVPEAGAIVALYATGLNVYQVARALSTNTHQVQKALHAAGTMRPQRKSWKGQHYHPGLDDYLPGALALAQQTLDRMCLLEERGLVKEDFAAVARLAAVEALATYQAEKGASQKTWIINVVRWRLQVTRRNQSGLSRGDWHAEDRSARKGSEPLSLEQLAEEEGFEPQGPEDPRRWLLFMTMRALFVKLPGRLQRLLNLLMAGESVAASARILGISKQQAWKDLVAVRAWFRYQLAAQGYEEGLT